jgi:hypothetical protein
MDLEALVLAPLEHYDTYKLQLYVLQLFNFYLRHYFPYILFNRPDGITFEARFEDQPSVLLPGQVVTVSYSSFSISGRPVNPVIQRVREDSEWNDEKEAKQSMHRNSLPPFSCL